jgi:proteasome alpha subunit
MQFYASPEQIMRDRSEYARKGIARGRSVVVLSYEGGVLFVAENVSTALHKVSEIYDRIGFAAVGRYPEFENLRAAGVRLADLHGYSYARRDVTGMQIANAYARTLGVIFSEQQKPFEVEICVAQVAATPDDDELYRITYDGSVQEEPGLVAMGGQAESISTVLKQQHNNGLSMAEAVRLAVEALSSVGGEGGQPREIPANHLEVAVLDRHRSGRVFRRLKGLALTSMLERHAEATPDAESGDDPAAAAAPEDAADSAADGADEAAGTGAAIGDDKPQPPAAPGTPADNASGGTPPAASED